MPLLDAKSLLIDVDGHYALPQDVRPTLYDLTLECDFDAFTFDGVALIDIAVTTPTDTLVLHAKELDIQNVSVAQGDAEQGAASISYSHDEHDLVVLRFNRALAVSTDTTLKISFKGSLNDTMAGFYRSTYTKNNETRYMAVTQFEAIDARRAFPCWDEPALKAQFNVTLIAPSRFNTILSNMPALSRETLSGDRVKVRFDTTPRMSTYLLAFVIGECDMVASQTERGVAVRVFAPLGRANEGRFALDVATITLDYFEEYYKEPYPLPKLDMIALPDFAAGAMENWGLVTYRETALLYDASTSPLSAKQRVAYVVAHELAHQWFGNLVTMKWWSGLWLNEGFATFVGTQAVNHLFPAWQTWNSFVPDTTFHAFNLDALRSSHPVQVAIKSGHLVDEIFDAISYEKGASIIRMLAAYLGEAQMQKGLHLYLQRHKYSNTVTTDLWDALGEASGKSVNVMMANWVGETGYPVLRVRETARIPGEEVFYAITQERYLANGYPNADEQAVTWHCSIPYRTGNNNEGTITLNTKHALVAISDVGPWLKLNSDQIGFYRVAYDAKLMKALQVPLQAGILSPLDRLSLLNDTFALAQSDHVPLSQALALTSNCAEETELAVWQTITDQLKRVLSVWAQRDTETYAQMFKYVQTLYAPLYKRLGWTPKKDEAANTSLLRNLALSMLGRVEYNDVVEIALDKFEAFKKDGTPLAPDHEAIIFNLAVEHGDAAVDAFLRDAVFAKAVQNDAKVRVLRALGNTPDVTRLQTTLTWALSGAVRKQDVIYVLFGMTAFPASNVFLWQFVQAKWDMFVKLLSGMSFMLGHVMACGARALATQTYAQQVRDFFEAHPTPTIERKVKQTVENIEANAQLFERHAKDVRAFLFETPLTS